MTEEMRQHVELEIADRVAAGMTPAEARRTALRDFGGVERWKEEARGARGLSGWDALMQDAAYGVRTLMRAPGFAVVAVGTLAVAIGATTAVFGVVEALLLEPLNYRQEGQLVRLFEHRLDDEPSYGTISAPNFRDWMASTGTLEAGALYDESSPTLRLGDRSLKLQGAWVNASFFDVLGVEPALGRFFLPAEDEPGSARAVLSWELWRQVFDADADIVGRVLDLNGFPYTVVGVAAPFEDPGLSGATFGTPQLWRSTPTYFVRNSRQSRSFTAVARLAPGVTVEAAEAELNAIHARLAEAHPGNRNRFVEVVPLKESIVGDARPALLLLSGAVALVLLIACANVANLLLFRAAGRGREIGVRTALGASRGRVVRQLLVESVLLGLLGAAGGVLVALVATRGLAVLAADQLPRLQNLDIDPAVLAFATGIGLAASLLFGLLPALHAVRADTAVALREAGRRAVGPRAQGRLRPGIVAVQVALAVVVVAGAGLLSRSLLRLAAVDPGLDADRALVLRMDPPGQVYGPELEDRGRTFLAVLDRVAAAIGAVPGVEAVGMVDLLPLSGSFNGNPYLLEGRPQPEPEATTSAETRAATAGFFEALGMRLMAGRTMLASDDVDAPRAAWVNEALLRQEGVPTERAVGTRIRLFGPEGDWYTIEGVLGDVAHFALDRAPIPAVYMPTAHAPIWMQDEPWIVVRAAGAPVAHRPTTRPPGATSTAVEPADLAPAIRDAIARIDPAIPVYDVAPMADVVASTLARERFRTVLLLAFAGVAFLLAAIGVYGMVAYTVARRRPELGIRMALGADAGAIRRLVIGQGLAPVAIGAAIGVAAALLASRAVAGFLFGISTTDPLTFVAAPIVLVAVAGLAAAVPARQAARTPPQEVLRLE